jgi:hypothetical protein
MVEYSAALSDKLCARLRRGTQVGGRGVSGGVNGGITVTALFGCGLIDHAVWMGFRESMAMAMASDMYLQFDHQHHHEST